MGPCTVPWFPELVSYTTPELPGALIRLVLLLDSVARQRGMGPVPDFIGQLEDITRLSRERCAKIFWLAEHLGLVGVIEVTTSEVGLT